MFFKSILISACWLVSAILANGYAIDNLRGSLFLSADLASQDSNVKIAGKAVAGVAEDHIKSVSASFKLPAVSGSGQDRALILVGLNTPQPGRCNNTLVGEFVLNESASPHYTGRGYFSDNTYNTPFSGLTFSAGEEVSMTITAKSATSATIVVNAHTYNMKTTTPLCLSGAFFALTAYPKENSNNEYYPLPKFGTFTINNAKVANATGTKAIENGADVETADMTIGGSTVVTTSVQHGSVIFKQTK